MEYIDAILYINLASRPDRQDHFLQDIAKLCIDNSKIHLVDAVYQPENGALGCTRSHIKAMEMFENNEEWNTIIIFEDDFTFKSDSVSYNNEILKQFFEEDDYKNWDVLNLSYNPQRVSYTDTRLPSVKRVVSTQTASGYCVSRNFLSTLKRNFEEAESNMANNNGPYEQNCCDQYWKKLQPTANWYLIEPSLGYQYKNYSDIEKKIISYGC